MGNGAVGKSSMIQVMLTMLMMVMVMMVMVMMVMTDDDDDGWRCRDISAAVHTDSRIQLHSHCLTLIYTDEESSIPFLLQDEARLPIQTYM